MKIGITFGEYSPLHQGHLDVIMRAKRENDRCVVFVCGYDNDPRGQLLPLIKRTRIIKNALEDSVTAVRSLDDTEIGIDESYSEGNWYKWLSYMKNKLAEMGYNTHDNRFVFYVGESSYEAILNKIAPKIFSFCNCVLVDRTENPISGTQCRNNPLKHWYKIFEPFRAYYTHKILIAGTASEGKTTLCQDLGRYFGIPYSYEKGRDICKIKTDPEMNVKDFIYNIYEQHKYNEELICSPQNPGIFVSDTDNMVTLMYAKPYAEREDFALTEEDYETLYAMVKTYAKTDRWDKIFLLAPHKRDIVDDGERYMGDNDYAIRVRFFEILKSLYDEFGMEYEILDGNFYDNFLAVKDYINGLYTESNKRD